MKIRQLVVCITLLILKAFAGVAQCGNTIQVTYDTTVTSTGNLAIPHHFTFPGFDGSQGTLLSVSIASEVTVTYGYTIENTDPTAKTARVRLTRYDEISGSTLPQTIDTTMLSPQNTHNLAANDGTSGSGPDFQTQPSTAVFDQYPILGRTYSNTASYIGASSVEFDYFYDIGVASPLGVDLASQADEQTTFSITYTYCDNVVMASDFTSFTAVRNNNEVNLRWSAANEPSDRGYELQKSTDGNSFAGIQRVNAAPDGNSSGTYYYTDPIRPNDEGTVWYRIKQIDRGNEVSYSPVRTVNLESRAVVLSRIAPNPATGGNFNIVFNKEVPGDWQVDILSSTGQLIARRVFRNAASARIYNEMRLTRGLYIIRATNFKTREQFAERLIVE